MDRQTDSKRALDLSRRRSTTGIGPESAGEALRLLRYRTRLTRDELATMVGVSAGALSNYENDVSAPSAVTLRRMTATFAELLGGSGRELWDQLGALLDQQEGLGEP